MDENVIKRFEAGVARPAGIALASAIALLCGLALLLLIPSGAPAHETTNSYDGIPLPEPGALAPIDKRPCTYDVEDPHQKRVYRVEGWEPPDYERYPGVCERLTFAHPVLVKPGQNDVLVEPVTIGKPLRDGYMTRFRPDLVTLAPDGGAEIPPVEEVHLHHGTWLNLSDRYGGTVPFIASGEEKTIGQFPRGYGMPIQAEDDWQLLYMVHSAIPDPMLAWIIYEIDFVPKAAAEDLGMKPAYPVWIDVRPSGYPVFNVQRGFGGKDNRCTWPKQRCADFNPWGHQEVGQGMPGNGEGNTDMQFASEGEKMGAVRNFTGGTLIGLGGHVHPGGLTDQVDLLRNGKETRIFTSEAKYWGWKNHDKPNGPPTSWDLSMTVTGLPYWGVHVKPDDVLRINTTYDTKHAATYENMGIVVGAWTPDGPNGKPQAPGINPFKVSHVSKFEDCLKKAGGWSAINKKTGVQAKRPWLCEEGLVTHGSHPPNRNHSGPRGDWPNPPVGPKTNDVGIAGFQYLPGDLGRIQAGGSVPQVKLGTNLRFTNLEGGAIYHSITTCKFPCLGPTSSSFPLGDGRSSVGRPLDLDSGQLGIGTPEISPAKQTLNWSQKVSPDTGFRKGEVVTYFCRVHPFMRGAFQVVE